MLKRKHDSQFNKARRQLEQTLLNSGIRAKNDNYILKLISFSINEYKLHHISAILITGIL